MSEQQTADAMKIFSTLARTFTSEARCVNCHGGVDPFAPATTHEGGLQKIARDSGGKFDVAATFKECQDCHSEQPKWRTPPKQFFFVGKNEVQLCVQMKQFGQGLSEHIGSDALIATGFAGTRGLNEVGQALLKRAYKAEPPTAISLKQLVAETDKWLEAMNASWYGEDDCGCVPQLIGIKVDERFAVTAAPIGKWGGTGEGTIALSFEPDTSNPNSPVLLLRGAGTIARTGTVNLNGVCTGTMQQTLTVNVSGTFNAMKGVLKITKADVQAGPTAHDMTCRVAGQTVRQASPTTVPAGAIALQGFDLPAVDGASISVPLNIPTMGVLNGQPGSTETATLTVVRIK
jgi:hypothetical protein